MTNASHRNINKANKISLKIGKGESTIEIYQDMAIADLDYLRRRRKMKIDPKILKEWVYSLIKAVAYLHANGFVHNDIKPSNVLLFKEGMNINLIMLKDEVIPQINFRDSYPKLTDFGLTRLILNAAEGISTNGLEVYTIGYRAPEVTEHKNYGFAADIWALGCTIYEIFYCEKLDVNDTMFETLASLENNLLNNLIKSMLKINPHERPNIFEVMADDFFLDFSTPLLIHSCKPSLSPPPLDLGDVEHISIGGAAEELIPQVVENKPLFPYEGIRYYYQGFNNGVLRNILLHYPEVHDIAVTIYQKCEQKGLCFAQNQTKTSLLVASIAWKILYAKYKCPFLKDYSLLGDELTLCIKLGNKFLLHL